MPDYMVPRRSVSHKWIKEMTVETIAARNNMKAPAVVIIFDISVDMKSPPAPYHSKASPSNQEICFNVPVNPEKNKEKIKATAERFRSFSIYLYCGTTRFSQDNITNVIIYRSV